LGGKMKSERIALWLSLFANLAVLAGLLILVAELRHNTLATQAMLYQDSLNYGRENAGLLVGDENKELAEIVFRGEVDPDSLSRNEFEKFVLFTSWRMGMWETLFLHRESGLLEERYWKNSDAWFSSLVYRGPGYKRWWETARHGYDAAFQDHVDEAFKRQP
jgi:hypothetical protein